MSRHFGSLRTGSEARAKKNAFVSRNLRRNRFKRIRFKSDKTLLLMNDDNENEDDRKVVANNDATRTAEHVTNDVDASKTKTVKTGEEDDE